VDCSIDHEFDYSYDDEYAENSGSGRAEDDESLPKSRGRAFSDLLQRGFVEEIVHGDRAIMNGMS